MSPSLQHHNVLGLRTAGASLLLAGRRSARSICLQAAGGGGSDGSATGSTTRPIGCPDLYNMTEAINAQVVPQQVCLCTTGVQMGWAVMLLAASLLSHGGNGLSTTSALTNLHS